MPDDVGRLSVIVARLEEITTALSSGGLGDGEAAELTEEAAALAGEAVSAADELMRSAAADE